MAPPLAALTYSWECYSVPGLPERGSLAAVGLMDRGWLAVFDASQTRYFHCCPDRSYGRSYARRRLFPVLVL